MADSDGDTHLPCTCCTTTAVGVALDVIGQAVVDDVREVIHVQPASRHVSRDEELEIADTELLHHVVTLSLRELAVQGISIVAITDKLIGDLLSLTTRAAEDDTVDIGVVVGDTLQSKVLVACRYDVVVVTDILIPLVLCPDDDLFGLVHVGGSDGADLTGHRSGEE